MMCQTETSIDFEKIRAQAKAINVAHGGKIEINEWTTGDGEVLKIVMTWKKQDKHLLA